MESRSRRIMESWKDHLIMESWSHGIMESWNSVVIAIWGHLEPSEAIWGRLGPGGLARPKCVKTVAFYCQTSNGRAFCIDDGAATLNKCNKMQHKLTKRFLDGGRDMSHRPTLQ